MSEENKVVDNDIVGCVCDNGYYRIERDFDSVTFIFHAVRVKETTGKERIRLNVYKDNDTYEYAEIYLNISKMDYEIKQLEDYGVIISRVGLNKITKEIRKVYYDIPVENYISKEIIKDVLQKVVEYSSNENSCLKDGLYMIPSSEADVIFEDKDRDSLNISVQDIKVYLKYNEIIKCNANRYDYAVKNSNGKVNKYYCFYEDKVKAFFAE